MSQNRRPSRSHPDRPASRQTQPQRQTPSSGQARPNPLSRLPGQSAANAQRPRQQQQAAPAQTPRDPRASQRAQQRRRRQPLQTQQRSSRSTREERPAPRKRRKRFQLPLALKILIIVILLPPVLVLGINFWMFLTTTGNMATPEELADAQADCIVVLGAGIEPDGTPSPILAERLDTAAVLYENGASSKILVSGGEDAAQSEVTAMRNYLLEAGVPAMAISADTHGVDTFASVHNLCTVYDFQRVILVSQRFHLYRAVYIGEHFGLDVSGCPASEEDISDSSLLMRERLARIKDFAQCKFGELPASVTSVGSAAYHNWLS